MIPLNNLSSRTKYEKNLKLNRSDSSNNIIPLLYLFSYHFITESIDTAPALTNNLTASN